MKTTLRNITLLAAILFSFTAFAQSNNLIVFSQDGYKFTLIVNGLRQNETPETNVKVTGLTAPNYKVRVIFADANLATIDQNIYMQWGGDDLHNKEISFAIENTKKGLKLRPQAPADLTTTTAPDQVVYVFNPNGNATQTGGFSTTTTTTTTGTSTTGTGASTTVIVPANNTSTTVNNGTGGTTSTTTTTTGTVDNANIGVNAGGVGVGINININDGMGGTSSSTTTTTTTTSSSTSTGTVVAEPQPQPVAVEQGCAFPMSSSDFAAAKKSVESKSFEDSKLTVAKQILNSNCMSSAQVKEIMMLFSFEETKLDWAKFAYGKTTDPNNYFKLNDGFTFETSIDDLNKYIESHK